MKHYDSIAAAADDVRDFFYSNKAALPDHVKDKLQPHVGTGSSPVDLTATFIKSAYANRDTLPKEALEIAAGCAELFDQNGFHNRLDGRAAKLGPVLRRDSGEKAVSGQTWPDKAKDPAVDDDFAPPPAPEEAAPAGE